MNLEKAVKRKVVEYNELTITREMLLDLVRGQRIGVDNNAHIVFDENDTEKFIHLYWERTAGEDER